MNSCAYCDANALYRDRGNGDYLCLTHARLEVTGPRGEAPRPPLTIRPSTPADRRQIAELTYYFWGETEIECFDHSYQVDTLPAYVACDEGEIVGAVSYARKGDADTLITLNVLPQWQGRGVARKLIAAVAEAARAEGATRLIVATSNDDLPALALYQRVGFTITGILAGRLVEHHGGVEAGFADIPVRDEIQLELRL
ncbi:MAG: hypothetical protein B6I35_02690 [Anaerolineaceae bacterium 4572_32.2]|nr:MAG: hypothetical protein B6I35_02690 [Anaerolineaceae bacterium 4572_32.2]